MTMTLDEAIKHCEEVADTCEDEASKYDMTDTYERRVACKEGECANEHRQLAEWLKELKQLREQTRWIPISERLPNRDEYIKNNGLFNVSDGNRSYSEWFDIYDKQMFGEPTISDFRVDYAVTAWMPLPEKYLPNCQCTDEEIAKSFIEDVEAVKDQLPCGEQMDFPSTFDEFAKDYGFKDKDEIYTNGSELIPVFRVKQWLEHISTTKNNLSSGLEKNSKKLEKDFGESDCISRADVNQVIPQEPRCKECKYWKDSDGVYRRGCRAESKCPINRREVFEGNGYCYLFEPRKVRDK